MKLVSLLVQQLQHQNKRKLKHHLNLFQVKVTDPKTGYGGWEATSGTLTLTQDTPVYTEPNKDGGVAYVQPQGDIQWDKYIFANGDNWYSFVQKNRDQEVRFYIAYSDVGH